MFEGIDVGDKVMLSEDSEWYNRKLQLVGVGTVKEIEPFSTLPYKVVPDNNDGRKNSYGYTDLILVELCKTKKPITSDGGTSSYYGVTLPKWLLDKHAETGSIMLEDLAEVLFDNEFNFSTNFKSLHRAFQTTKGIGKKGNTLGYECNKIKYYADKIVEKGEREK